MEPKDFEENNVLLRELFNAIKMMRKYQKDFFLTHSRTAMANAKRLEKEVDRRIEGIDFPTYDIEGKRLPYAK